MSKRAIRRHNTQRMKVQLVKKERNWPYWISDDSSSDEIACSAGIFANHGCTCSCTMCGNPRRHWKELTIQEKRNIEDFNYSLEYLDEQSDN